MSVMTNLFSIFDPTAIFAMSFNWFTLFFFMTILVSNYWKGPVRQEQACKSVLDNIHKEMEDILEGKSKTGALLFIAVFTVIFFNNFLGLFPWVFTSTSHISISLSFALPLWGAFLLYGILRNLIKMMSHFVPGGTPPPLTPFMVVIETISLFIRPLTLAIRLSANMVAGHLLLVLVGDSFQMIFLGTGALGSMIGLILLLMLEIAVSMIQAYVFMILLALYMAEN